MNEQLAGLRPIHRDVLRTLGITLFAAGAIVLFLRKADAGQWAAFPKLLVLAIPCAFLYGLGVGAIRLGRPDDGAPSDPHALAAWRSTALAFGLILLPLTLAQLVDTLGGDPSKNGHLAWIFLVTAGAAFAAAFGRGLRWGALLGGLALIASWMAFWDVVVDPSGTAIRWLLVLIAAALAAGTYVLRADPEGPELATAAGVAALLAGITGLLTIIQSLTSGAISGGFAGDAGTQQHQEWDVFLLAVAAVLIWYGTRVPWRGPVYVGAITLFAFVLSVSFEVVHLFSGESASGDVVGWPLLLLVLGAGALLAGLYGGGAPQSPPPDPAEDRLDPAQ